MDEAPPPLGRLALLAAFIAPLGLLWPLPALVLQALMGGPPVLLTAPEGEGPVHLWSWWAALAEGRPLSFSTDLLNFPYGLEVQVIDPLHILPFALGSLVGGPAVGLGLVCWLGLFLMGLSGLLLSREAGAGPQGQLVGTAAALACSTVLAVAVDGITEGFGVGWVGIQLALLLSLRRQPSWGRVLLLPLCIAAGVHAGAYNGVWMALVDVPVGLWLLRRTRRHLLSGLLAGLVCLPYLLAAAGIGEGRPGAADRAPPLLPPPASHWRGTWMEGTDLLDLFVPAPLTGATALLPTTAYLGAFLLVLAGLGLARNRRAWPFAAGALVFALLALGPCLVVGGEVTGIPTPAMLLERFTPLGRLTRWYRAGAVAVLLLSPLAALSIRRPPVAAIAGLLLLLDGRLLSPVPLSLPLIFLPDAGALVGLQGAMAEQPPMHPVHRPGTIADLNLLLQVQHGQPTSGTLDSIPGKGTLSPGMRGLQRALALPPGPEGQALARDATRQLTRLGYRFIVLYPSLLHGTDSNLRAVAGDPVREDEVVRVFAVGGSE